MSEATERINEVIMNSSNQIQMAPSWVANAAFKKMDPERITPWSVKEVALTALKQIAMRMLRGKFEQAENPQEIQHPLFTGLQMRYPKAHKNGEEPIYVVIEHLTASDIEWNVGRLRAESVTKMQHAAALEAWGYEQGLLSRRAA